MNVKIFTHTHIYAFVCLTLPTCNTRVGPRLLSISLFWKLTERTHKYILSRQRECNFSLKSCTLPVLNPRYSPPTPTPTELDQDSSWCLMRQNRQCHCVLTTRGDCNTLHHSASLCNALQHTATHCNTLQHIQSFQHEDIATYPFSNSHTPSIPHIHHATFTRVCVCIQKKSHLTYTQGSPPLYMPKASYISSKEPYVYLQKSHIYIYSASHDLGGRVCKYIGRFC